MDPEQTESRYERSQERYDDDSPVDNAQRDSKKSRESSKHRSKDGKKSRREERDFNNKDKDLSKASDDLKQLDKETRGPGKDRVSGREKRKDEKEEHQKHRAKGKSTERDHDRDKNRERDHERDTDKRERRKEREHDGENEMEKEFERGRDERGKERSRDRDKERERDKRDRVKETERERHIDRDKERGYEKDKGREKTRDRERDFDEDKVRDREKTSKRNRDDGYDRNKDVAKEARDIRDTEAVKGIGSPSEEESGMIIEQEEHVESAVDSKNQSASEIKDRILRMKEERLKRKSEGSEVLSWVNKLGKLEDRRKEEKQKAFLRSKMFEEQDKIDEDDDDDQDDHSAGGLAGVKVLHGLDKVAEGGSIVLTLKDSHILAGGDVNEELDMLENVEIGEQKHRDEAYKAAKKKTGIFDQFNDQDDSEKKMLPQYDDPVTDEGVTLDASGRFSGEAEKKLEELRQRLKGPLVKSQVDDLNSSSARVTSDYYTPEEMLQFKKPKKKKSLRKKEKLDIDALEAEAIAAGLGVADLGSRNDPNRQAAKEELKRSEVERRNSAYQTAKTKADEASRALRFEQSLATTQKDDVDNNFVDETDDYQKCLDRVRKVALTKQKEERASGPEAIALFAAFKINKSKDDLKSGEPLENNVVITEMEEFVQGLHIDEEVTKPGDGDFFMEEDEAPKFISEENREDTGSQVDTEDIEKHIVPEIAAEADIVADEIIHEAPVGKGAAGALKRFKEIGALKETVDWGGRNMDKKKSKLVGIYDEGAPKEIRIDRTDEYGRIQTPKEAFRVLSHRFHGKAPGKMKQEKRQKQYFDELKLKQMKNSDTPSDSVARMREAQALLKTPYLMISGNVKSGQTTDPTSGFATVERNFPGSLTPMLGDKKVEHFLGIKRKADTPSSGAQKKPKP